MFACNSSCRFPSIIIEQTNRTIYEQEVVITTSASNIVVGFLEPMEIVIKKYVAVSTQYTQMMKNVIR